MPDKSILASSVKPISNGHEDSETELTLDPPDWDAFRALGHRMIDDVITYLATVRQRPVWERISADAPLRTHEELSILGRPADTVYNEFVREILPFPYGNIHPRFWGWVNGSGAPVAVLAELLAATMNPNVSGREQAATFVERRVVNWLKQLVGFPAEGSGLLVSGASVANLIGLAVARSQGAGYDVRTAGLHGGPQLVVYCSAEAHLSVRRAVDILGLGAAGLRCISTGEDYRLDPAVLAARVANDRAQGLRPLCVVGNAGTVNTGAIDDLPTLAAFCRSEALWFHIDGAFGALTVLSERERYRVAGLELADSLAFDLHKWMYLPIEVGCVLVRHEGVQHKTFAMPSDYLAGSGSELANGVSEFADLGPQLTRSFRALKVWMAMKTYGTRLLGNMVTQNIDQAQYLTARVQREAELELLAPVALNVVCFRYIRPSLPDAVLNGWNRTIVRQLHDAGMVVPSTTILDGRFAIRAAITNHRTCRKDLDLLIDEVLRLGQEID